MAVMAVVLLVLAGQIARTPPSRPAAAQVAANFFGGYAARSMGRPSSWLFAVLALALAAPALVSPAAAAPKPKAQAAKKEKKAKKGEAEKEQEGVKSYKFGTIEIEGRLKSPQIIYFLRRVRAEFDAGALGHRSFLRELSDTRRSPSFR